MTNIHDNIKMILKNKVAVISGISKIFGMAVANLFNKDGANITIVSRNEKLMNKTVEEISSSGRNIIGIKCDSTNREDVKVAIEKIIDKYGKMDILFNNDMNFGGSIIIVSAAKREIIGLTKNLAKELRNSSIRVNCIGPGIVRKDFDSKNQNENFSHLKRNGTLIDIANAVLYFASDMSNWITGQTLIIDRGELFLEIEDE